MIAELLTRRAPLRGNSYDAETRSFAGTFATSAPVTRRDAAGSYTEILDLSAVDPDALIGLTVYSDHEIGSRTAVGQIVAAWREGDAIAGRVTLSAASDVESLRTKIAEGVIRGLSIGYGVASTTTTRDASGRRVVTVRPVIRELSVTPNPADQQSVIRSGATMEDQTPAPARTAEAVRGIVAEAVAAALAGQRAAPQPERTIIRAAVTGHDATDPAVISRAKVEALAARMTGAEPTGPAAQYRAWGVAEHAADSLRQRNVAGIQYMSREAVIAEACRSGGMGGLMGSGDFVSALGGASQITLANAYQAAPAVLKTIAVSRTVNDFRNFTVAKLSGLGNLEEVSEHGEIRAGSPVEGSEVGGIATFAKSIGVTFRTLVNDDLGVVARLVSELGRSAAATEAKLLADKLLSNPVMNDTVAMFHTTHANLAGAGAVLGINAVTAARLAMRRQVGLSGELIAVTPRYLVVGPENETFAETLLASIYAASLEDVNPHAGKLQLLVEPRIPGVQWFLCAAPTELANFETVTLAGHAGPQITHREGWSTLGIEYRVVHHYGVNAIDYRACYRSAGV